MSTRAVELWLDESALSWTPRARRQQPSAERASEPVGRPGRLRAGLATAVAAAIALAVVIPWIAAPSDRAAAPHRLPATVAGARQTVEVARAAELHLIARCESGGDPGAISPDGRYRGKYQFDFETWRSVGGRGDPASAPIAEQNLRAEMLLRSRGHWPWPVCGARG